MMSCVGDRNRWKAGSIYLRPLLIAEAEQLPQADDPRLGISMAMQHELVSWLTYPSDTYEFVSEDDNYSQYMDK